jgi:hypothetical protein
MRILLALLVSTLFLASAPVRAQAQPVDLGHDPALTVAGPDLAPTDARVVQVRAWLKQVATATGENETQVAASCVKLSRYLFDALRVRAVPSETLEGLTVQLAPGKPLGDMTSAYFRARQAAPDKSHAGAMATLTGKAGK